MAKFSKLRDMKILFVDGDEWVRDSLSLFFEADRHHFLALETAEEAIRILNSQRYDIIISDYRLPDMDGVELLRLVTESHPYAMKILVTAYGDRDIVSEADRMGIDDFIEKPFTTEVIKGSLEQLIEKRAKNNSHVCAEGGS